MFAALHLPDLPVVAALRRDPDLGLRPCAVLEAGAGHPVEKVELPLLAVNGAARTAGIVTGWPLNRALVRCPDLRVLAPDPAAQRQLLEEMVAAAETLTPDLEITCADTLILDLSRAAPGHATSLAGLAVAGGMLRHARSSTPDLARLAVREERLHGRCVTAADLRGLPLAHLGRLPGAAERLGLLSDWGLRSLGDFMDLPRQDLIGRLGPVAGEWHDLLHGRIRRLLRLHRPPESLERTMEFEHPVEGTEPLVFACKRLLHSLVSGLAARHAAAGELRVELSLESGKRIKRTIRLPDPRVGETDLLRPIRGFLDSLALDSPVTAVGIDAGIAAPTAAQRDWFARQLPRPGKWIEMLARLETLVGPGRVGIPVPRAGHRPDAFSVLPADQPVAPVTGGRPPGSPVPLKRFRPPHDIAVASGAGPVPLALLTGPHRGGIVGRRGPFKRSGDWWEPGEAWMRMEWDVELEDHRLLRLAFIPPGNWQLDGIYV